MNGICAKYAKGKIAASLGREREGTPFSRLVPQFSTALMFLLLPTGHYYTMEANDSLSNTTNMQDNSTTSEPAMVMYSELEHTLMSGSLLLIMLANLIGSGTVCLAVYRRRKLRTRTNMFVINLSIADIGVAVLCMPFSLVTCLRHDWVLGDALCKLNGFLNIVFCLTSLLTLTAISVETYFAICKPLYHRHMSRKFAWGLLLWTWIQPIVIASVPFFGILEYEFKPGIVACLTVLCDWFI